jgi:hypothetical protein
VSVLPHLPTLLPPLQMGIWGLSRAEDAARQPEKQTTMRASVSSNLTSELWSQRGSCTCKSHGITSRPKPGFCEFPGLGYGFRREDKVCSTFGGVQKILQELTFPCLGQLLNEPAGPAGSEVLDLGCHCNHQGALKSTDAQVWEPCYHQTGVPPGAWHFSKFPRWFEGTEEVLRAPWSVEALGEGDPLASGISSGQKMGCSSNRLMLLL